MDDGAVCHRCAAISQFYQAPPDKITPAQQREYKLMQDISAGACSARSVEALRAGTRLNAAARHGLAYWCERVLEYPDYYWERHAVLQACLEVGAIDAASDSDASTPAPGSYEHAKWLLKSPARGNTWLHLVCGPYWIVAGIELLLDHGAAAVINARNDAGDTPLHCYLQRVIKHRQRRPTLTGVRLLLDHGADPTLINSAGQTPADLVRAAACETPDAQQHQRALLALLGVPSPA